MKCGMSPNLLNISISKDNKYILLSRCCALELTSIPIEDFFSMSFEELNKLNLINNVVPGRINRCRGGKCEIENFDSVLLGFIQNCNFSCYHCCSGFDHSDNSPFTVYFSNDEKLERKNILFKVLKKIIELKKVSSITLDGSGEIFIYYKELIEFIQTEAKKKDFNIKNIVFLTNGSLLDNYKIEELYKLGRDNNINFIFFVSIDELYGKKSRNMNGIQLLPNIINLGKKFQVIINLTVKKVNEDQVFKVRDCFKKLGFKISYNYDCFDMSVAQTYLQLREEE